MNNNNNHTKKMNTEIGKINKSGKSFEQFVECFFSNTFPLVHNIACRKIPKKSPTFDNSFFPLWRFIWPFVAVFIHKKKDKYVPDFDDFERFVKTKNQLEQQITKHMQNICFQRQ